MLILSVTTAYALQQINAGVFEGPTKGALALVGGGGTNPQVMQRFIVLGGGLSGRFLVILSALPPRLRATAMCGKKRSAPKRLTSPGRHQG
jgi:hypothetical protein